MQQLFLSVADAESSADFKINFPEDLQSSMNQTTIVDSSAVFKRMLPLREPVGSDDPVSRFLPSYTARSTVGYLLHGTLTTKTGDNLTIIVEWNLPSLSHYLFTSYHSMPVPGIRLKMFHEGKLRTLFQTWWLQLSPGGPGGPIDSVPLPLPSR